MSEKLSQQFDEFIDEVQTIMVSPEIHEEKDQNMGGIGGAYVFDTLNRIVSDTSVEGESAFGENALAKVSSPQDVLNLIEASDSGDEINSRELILPTDIGLFYDDKNKLSLVGLVLFSQPKAEHLIVSAQRGKVRSRIGIRIGESATNSFFAITNPRINQFSYDECKNKGLQIVRHKAFAKYYKKFILTTV